MSYRILLVDDNPAESLLVGTSVEEGLSDSQCVTASELSEAERRMALESFDAVLMDLSLRDSNGFENLAQLIAASPRTPIIVLTSSAAETDAIEALQRGAADYLIKGATEPALLERAVRYAIERKRHENDRLELERARIARAEAEAANRAKDEFLATLSHELRTPLNAILGWASLLRTGQLGPKESSQALETIERNARVQAQLIEDLLDVSRIVTGNFRLHPVHVPLKNIVQQAVEALSPVAAQKQVELTMEVKTDPMIHGDATRLQQVAWNLIANAVKFTPPEGKVWVEVDATSDDNGAPLAVLCVRDNGQGIEPDFMPRIFDRFRQGDATATRRHGGLGLGLAIVRNVVHMHQGKVEAASPGRGQGATFKVLLPALKPKEAIIQPDTETPHALTLSTRKEEIQSSLRAPSLQGARILGVEDDSTAGDFLRKVFGRCGADVQVASSVPEALTKLERPEWVPDLIICDLGMPDADGYTLLRRLRTDFPGLRDVPVAVCTAYAPEGEAERAFAAGFAAFWAKPMEPEVMCAAASVLYESTHKPG